MNMELTVTVKGSKYIVQDKKLSRLLYTVKKKGFGAGKYILMDASNYSLYSFVQTGDDRKPTFAILNNDVQLINLACKSLFLDPTITVQGRDTGGDTVDIAVTSKDHRSFRIVKDGVDVGAVKVLLTVSGDLQYEIVIEDKVFDDYIPLFAVAVDITFGDMNKSK